jgi:hypothetical protein
MTCACSPPGATITWIAEELLNATGTLASKWLLGKQVFG